MFPDADSSYQYRGYQTYGNNKDNDYTFQISPHYTHYKNTPGQQKKSVLDINLKTYYSNTNDEGREVNYKRKYENSNLNADFYYNVENRWYYQTNNFFETDIIVDFQTQKTNSQEEQSNSDQNSQDHDIKTHTIKVDVPVKWGIGRIEQVQDARHAVYLFNELSKIGKVTTDIYNEDILKFASFISELKNKRFFDSRKRRKFEYMALDSFLSNNGYLKESDMDYFSTLSEYWLYGSLQVRNSGSRISFVFQPAFTANHYSMNHNNLNLSEIQIYDYNSHSFIYTPVTHNWDESYLFNAHVIKLKAGLEYLYEKPINLKWQNTIFAYANGGYFTGKIKGESYSLNEIDDPNDYYDEFNESGDTLKNDIRKTYFEIGYSQNFGWYPTTRTAVNFSYSGKYAQFIKQANKKENVLNFDAKAIRLNTELTVKYYISERLRLGAGWRIFYQWQNSTNELMTDFDSSELGLINYYSSQSGYIGYRNPYRTKRFYQDFNVNLSYSIF